MSDILERYAQAAMRAWTPERLKQARSLKDKSYLTREFLMKWSFGFSPSLDALRRFGLTDDELESVGLLCDRGNGKFPFFRDRLIVTFFENERVVYLTSRRLSDTGPDGQPLPKHLKAMSLPSPPRGVAKPDGFNLDVLVNRERLMQRGLWLVEAPLEAAYLTETGQPAVGFVGGQLWSCRGLVKRTRGLFAMNIPVYAALDGTPDVTEEDRVLSAAAIHPNARICLLPNDRDPDTLSPKEIEDISRRARRVVDVYLEALDRDRQALVKGESPWSHEHLPSILKQWRRQLAVDKAQLSLLDIDMRTALSFQVGEYREYVEQLESNGQKPLVDVPALPKESATGPANAIDPPDEIIGEEPPCEMEIVPREFDADAGRPVVRNFEVKTELDEKGKPKNYKEVVLLQDIVSALKLATGDWPRAAGGMLFDHNKGNTAEPIKILSQTDELFGWMQSKCVVRWDGGSDRKARALVTKGEFFAVLRDHVQTYDAIEICPHEPPIPNYYYAYEPDPDYVPDGRYFRKLLKFFNNVETNTDRELIKAMFMTPMAGLQFDKRPAFAITAGQRDCGKSTLAEAVGELYGGHIELRLSRDPERDIFSRLLAPNNIYKRVARIDNVKGLCSSAELEAIITSKVINGHRLHHGDASRPNNLTFIFTGNALTLSSDIARRTFTISVTKPTESDAWETELKQYITQCKKRIYADIVAELRQPTAAPKLKGGTGGWAGWARLVLSHCARPDEIIETTRERRSVADEEVDEAEAIMDGIDEAIDEWNRTGGESYHAKYGIKAQFQGVGRDVVFIKARDMAEILNQVIQARRLTPTQAGRRMQVHIKAGRLPRVQEARADNQRGYYVVLNAPLPEQRKSLDPFGQQYIPYG